MATHPESGPGPAATAPRLTLISHHLCPYVQRASIVLDEKQVPFERIDVDLGDKPEWFGRLSPLGKVPVLKVANGPGPATVLFESAVIVEFLDETLPHALHPEDPLERARHRSWIEFGSATLNAIWRFYSATDGEALGREAHALSEMFARIERELGPGPWFAGERFSIVDAVYGPIFRYFDVFDEIADFGILSGKPKVRAWRDNLAERRSVRRAVKPDYPERLREFLFRRNSALSLRMAA